MCFAQCSGWRVPSVKELMTLVDFSISADGSPAIDPTFVNTPEDLFWSSSATPDVNGQSVAWVVHFDPGDSSASSTVVKTWGAQVRCVR
jgi:hypothetical protein